MKLLDVHYRGWGEDFQVGRLAEQDRSTIFEYSSAARARGLEL